MPVLQIIYGLPVSLSAIPRLSTIARQLGPGTISVFADHPDHIRALEKVDAAAWPGKIPVWVNIDVGDHREGVPATSQQLADIARVSADSQRTSVVGIYTHLGSSYASSSPEDALEYMAQELQGLEQGALAFKDVKKGDSKFGLSLGATPTATSLQTLLDDSAGAKKYRDMIEKLKASYDVEYHAGVGPVNDMQQLATRARKQDLLSFRDLGFRVLAEVASVYPDRGDKPEALIAAGSIVLGREPCKSYPGWGVVTPWPASKGQHYDPEGSKTGWIVGRISQEHGVLTYEGSTDGMRQLAHGEKVLIWPNHACIAGVNFAFYLVVDSENEDPEKVVDVWVRWRGW